jgi:hypothetical protein
MTQTIRELIKEFKKYPEDDVVKAELRGRLSQMKEELEFLMSIEYFGLAIEGERGEEGVNIAFSINKRVEKLRKQIAEIEGELR